MDYPQTMPRARSAADAVLDGGEYVTRELEFLAGFGWLAEMADGVSEEWAGGWAARCRELVRAVARRCVLLEVDGHVSVDTGLTEGQMADALYVCGMGAVQLVRQDLPVATYGLEGVRRCMDVREAGELALGRNSVLAVCRAHLGGDVVTEGTLREEWVALHGADGGTPQDFDRLFAGLRQDGRVVLGLGRMCFVADDEDVPGYPEGVTQPAVRTDPEAPEQ